MKVELNFWAKCIVTWSSMPKSNGVQFEMSLGMIPLSSMF